VARKSSAGKPKVTGKGDPYLAFLGYQLGYASVWFPALESHFGVTADLGEPVPPALHQEFERLLDVTRRVSPLIPKRGEDLGNKVAYSAQEVWQAFEGAWGGEAHCRNIEQREASEPEFGTALHLSIGIYTPGAAAQSQKIFILRTLPARQVRDTYFLVGQ
jgi:hypothetical protein